MLEFFIKQIAGDIDIDQVKNQMQQFAALFVQIHNNTKACLEILQRMEAQLLTPPATVGNIPLIGDNSNGPGNHNGSDDNTNAGSCPSGNAND